MPELDDLIARLEKAESIDEQLAADIAALFFDKPYYPKVYGLALRLTDDIAAIGAALALVEKVLPRAWIRIDRDATRPMAVRWRCEINAAHPYGWGPNAPLAILLALLRDIKSGASDAG